MLLNIDGISTLRLKGASQKSTKVPSWAEIAAEPSAPEWSNKQQYSEDEQQEVTKLGIEISPMETTNTIMPMEGVILSVLGHHMFASVSY